MNDFRIILRSLSHYGRSHVGVLLGAALASSILTGALLVGDSVKGSLRQFALQRLGGAHFALYLPNRFVSKALSDDLGKKVSARIAPAVQLRGMAIHQGEMRRQVNQVQVIGVDELFWGLASVPLALDEGEVAVNEKLALSLGVSVGDEISLRVGRPSQLPMDAPLATRSDERTVRGRFIVRRVLGNEELGRFSLSPSQVAPYSAFVSLHSKVVRGAERGDGAEQDESSVRINMMLAGGGTTSKELGSALARLWRPEHLGLRFRRDRPELQLESERIYLLPETARAAMQIPGARGVLTYLVNSISRGDEATPYSFVTAGPVPEDLADDEIIINRWLADAVEAGKGSLLKVSYFELAPSNEFTERRREFTVADVLETESLAMEKRLVPSFPGLTDVDRCAEWDLGIPMEEELLDDKANEAYWDQYRQTPKALVTLRAGQEMWANRFGGLTGVRWPLEQTSEAEVRAALRETLDPAKVGLTFQPVRDQALDAVSQALDFGQLFLGMSFFLIVSALMLTALLFVFHIQQRAREMGTLLAVGWRSGRVRALFLGEGAILALAGALLGAWGGMAYTKALIWGLSRHWQGAVAHAAIQYHAGTGTVGTGVGISFLCALGAMTVAMWRQAKQPPRALLAEDFSQTARAITIKGGASRWDLILAIGCVAAAVGFVAVPLLKGAADMVMPFFGAGGMLLLGGIGFSRYLLGAKVSASSLLTLPRMAWRNAARRRGRSLTVVGLLACGCFLVFAISTMQEDVTAHADEPSAGTGGFEWYAESTLQRLRGTRDGLSARGCSDQDARRGRRKLPESQSRVVAFVTRCVPGQDVAASRLSSARCGGGCLGTAKPQLAGRAGAGFGWRFRHGTMGPQEEGGG